MIERSQNISYGTYLWSPIARPHFFGCAACLPSNSLARYWSTSGSSLMSLRGRRTEGRLRLFLSVTHPLWNKAAGAGAPPTKPSPAPPPRRDVKMSRTERGAPLSCEEETGSEICERRIAPLLDESRPDSCSGCHLSGIDLASFMRGCPCTSMTCLIEQLIGNGCFCLLAICHDPFHARWGAPR